MEDVSAQARRVLLRQYPPFSLLSEEALELSVLTGSTNLTFIARGKQDTCIIKRLASTDGKLINRERQLQIIKQASRLQISPSHFYQDKDWRIQQYLKEFVVTTPCSVLRTQFLRPFLHKLVSFHAIALPRPAELTIERALNVTFAIDRLEEALSGIKESQLLNQILTEFKSQGRERWQHLLNRGQKSVCLCHNDLNLLNILTRGEEVFFIDMQYAGYNFLQYDLANFIFQSTIDYQFPSPPYFAQSQPLSDQWVLKVTRLYAELAHYDQAVLLKGVRECLMLCNLFWAAWSISFRNPTVKLDYKQYGLFRIRQFKRMMNKSEWINS